MSSLRQKYIELLIKNFGNPNCLLIRKNQRVTKNVVKNLFINYTPFTQYSKFLMFLNIFLTNSKRTSNLVKYFSETGNINSNSYCKTDIRVYSNMYRLDSTMLFVITDKLLALCDAKFNKKIMNNYSRIRVLFMSDSLYHEIRKYSLDFLLNLYDKYDAGLIFYSKTHSIIRENFNMTIRDLLLLYNKVNFPDSRYSSKYFCIRKDKKGNVAIYILLPNFNKHVFNLIDFNKRRTKIAFPDYNYCLIVVEFSSSKQIKKIKMYCLEKEKFDDVDFQDDDQFNRVLKEKIAFPLNTHYDGELCLGVSTSSIIGQDISMLNKIIPDIIYSTYNMDLTTEEKFDKHTIYKDNMYLYYHQSVC